MSFGTTSIATGRAIEAQDLRRAPTIVLSTLDCIRAPLCDMSENALWSVLVSVVWSGLIQGPGGNVWTKRMHRAFTNHLGPCGAHPHDFWHDGGSDHAG